MDLFAPPLVVSADSPAALAAQARRLRHEVESTSDAALWDLAQLHLAASHDHHRGAVIACDRSALLRGLSALAEGRTARGVTVGTADLAQRPVLVFPGQGAQWAGMATGLLESSPAFRAHFEKYVEMFRPHSSFDMAAALSGRGADLSRLDVIQPVQFAVTSALADLWRDCGLRPAAVVGHSMGEVAAAHAAGALSQNDAARLTGRRCELLTLIEGQGAMASIIAPADRARLLLDRWGDRLSISAVNSGSNITVSGDRIAVAELLAEAANQNIWAWQIPGMTVAAHAPQFDALREQILEAASTLVPRPPHTAFYSTVTATRLDETALTPVHWYRNLRSTVLFERAVRALIEDGHRFFIEVSAHPMLTTPLREILHDANMHGVAIPTLDRRENDAVSLLHALAHAFVNGAPINWEVACAMFSSQRGTPPRNRPPEHPLLRHAVELAHTGETVYFGRLSLETHSWLRDHSVHRRILLPTTAILDLVAYVGEHAGSRRVDELVLETPLELPDHGEQTLQVVLSEVDDTGARAVSVYSRPINSPSSTSWTRHASGQVSPRLPAAPVPQPWPPQGAQPVDVTSLHKRLSHHGHHYGPMVRGTTAVWQMGGTVFAEVSSPEFQGRPHPATLDAVLHALLLASDHAPDGEEQPQLLSTWYGVSLNPRGSDRLRVRLSSLSDSGRWAVTAFDLTGRPVFTADSVALHSTRPNTVETSPGAALPRSTQPASEPPLIVDHLALSKMAPAERQEKLIEIVVHETSAVVGHPCPANTQTFQEIGLDSTTAVELSNRIATAFGMTLPPTVAFDHANPAALARYLHAQLIGDDSGSFAVMLAELDRIASALPRVVQNASQRAQVETRLRRVLFHIEEAASDTFADRIQSATNEEILDVLDEQFGHTDVQESSADGTISHDD